MNITALCFFLENSVADWKNEKLISQPPKVTLGSCNMLSFYVYKIQKVRTNINENNCRLKNNERS